MAEKLNNPVSLPSKGGDPAEELATAEGAVSSQTGMDFFNAAQANDYDPTSFENAPALDEESGPSGQGDTPGADIDSSSEIHRKDTFKDNAISKAEIAVATLEMVPKMGAYAITGDFGHEAVVMDSAFREHMVKAMAPALAKRAESKYLNDDMFAGAALLAFALWCFFSLKKLYDIEKEKRETAQAAKRVRVKRRRSRSSQPEPEPEEAQPAVDHPLLIKTNPRRTNFEIDTNGLYARAPRGFKGDKVQTAMYIKKKDRIGDHRFPANIEDIYYILKGNRDKVTREPNIALVSDALLTLGYQEDVVEQYVIQGMTLYNELHG